MKLSTRIFFTGLLLFFITFTGFAQVDDEEYDYSTEFIWGINKNTNGGLIGGFFARYGTRVNDRVFQTFGVELLNVKHPKEMRYPSYTGNTYIWGKTHYLYAIRPQYGRDILLFKKAPQQGVQINYSIAAGPTVGIHAPYYIEISKDGGVQRVHYDPALHDQVSILGTGGLFQGIGESNLLLGAHLRTAISFEFGTFQNNVTGLEFGFSAEVFPNEVILMPKADNRSFFTAAFVTLFYGSRR
jgi:hypothetical protein